ncbi:TIGR03790 family protein [[Limnothrix rosea] IAM M-220]|uniref:TIGR03790 family protein n=1 Tax=[Limnothrix rosea] IAM M-220 TaxID=454133 RepID=UPI0009612D61|nr:TIGR03790 family protein [[Limnothrix rosea] IAM M-220]OKH17810.1 TIGR03790 family protein [[Limnothrix rosea] IAM M-220]
MKYLRLDFLGFSLIGLILAVLLSYQWFVVEEIDSYDYRFTAQNLGVVVNRADPLSVQIGRYYQTQRQIPVENMIYVEFETNQEKLSRETFSGLRRQIYRQSSGQIQGYALTWAAPYRVDCMSITSAIAFGFDEKYCASGCEATAPNPFFNRDSTRPYGDYQVRPTMMIAAKNFIEAKALIDRGVMADGTYPEKAAYLLSTSDKARNARAPKFTFTQQLLGARFQINMLQQDGIADRDDVMFYFTGKTKVKDLNTLTFLPGAIADHLTSFGGQLTNENSGQMSSLRWLEAGATGSYGTVVEPCNFPAKFSDPSLVMEAYLDGRTLLESYWQSVLWPGQGVFIGEPLARPFGDQTPKKVPPIQEDMENF